MADKKKEALFYYRAMKEDEAVLALIGTEYVEEESSKWHFHNLLEIAVCRRGKGKIIAGKQKFQYREGTVMVIPASCEHAIISKEGENSFWEYIYINPQKYAKYMEVFRRDQRIERLEFSEFPIIRTKDDVEFLFSAVNLLMDQLRIKEYGYRQSVSALTYVILIEILKMYYEYNDNQMEKTVTPQRISRHLVRAIDYIEGHYREKLSTSDIAKESYISPTFLRTLFQEYFHMSPMHYVNYVRIQKACKLIRRTDDTLSEIAQKVGYDNLSTFINNFKVHTGQTPRSWKEKNRER